MTAIVDYGVGNLFSLQSSFSAIGENVVVTSDVQKIKNSDRVILPGVGAFEEAAKKLDESGMAELVKSEIAMGKPVMGICLGMQLLFDKSLEYGQFDGLGLIPGDIVPIRPDVPDTLKIPHIGWNALHFVKDCPIFKFVNEGECVYFVHSFYAKKGENTVATTEYGTEITAAVAKDNLFGCQFHPEKSGKTGLNILRAFCEVKG